MAPSRGKQFEDVIKKCFLNVRNVSVDRIHDQLTGFKGSQNICDFIVYKKPYEYYIECKSIHGNTFPFKNITDTQWNGLTQKSCIEGVKAGILCWWIDKDVTRWIPINIINYLADEGAKSIRYDTDVYLGKNTHKIIDIPGKKKRIFFDYDMEVFFYEIQF